MKKIVRNKKGFTLIELMAVIVILAVVMLLVANRITNTSKDAKGRAFYIELKAVRKNVEQDCLLNGFVKKSSLEEYKTKNETTVTGEDDKDDKGKETGKVNITVTAIGSKFTNINIPPELKSGETFTAVKDDKSPTSIFTIENCKYKDNE